MLQLHGDDSQWGSFHFVIYRIILTVFGFPPWSEENLQRKHDPQICQCNLSAYCLLCFCFLAITQFPLVCKTALSSVGGSGSSKFNLPALSDQTMPYFSDQLSKPHVARCSGHIENTVVNSCPGVV